MNSVGMRRMVSQRGGDAGAVSAQKSLEHLFQVKLEPVQRVTLCPPSPPAPLPEGEGRDLHW
jgi:hypothetical protein